MLDDASATVDSARDGNSAVRQEEKSMRTKTMFLAALSVLVLTGHTTTATADGMAFGRSQAPALLEGPWVVTIRPIFCSGPSAGEYVPNIPPVTSHLTFGHGGTLIEATSNPALGAGKRTPGHGWWERTGSTSYQFAMQAFLVEPSAPYQSGLQRIEQTLELQTDDEWTSSGTVKFYSVFDINVTPAPAPYRSGCARANGVRMY
jgi:hypothetical protein